MMDASTEYLYRRGILNNTHNIEQKMSIFKIDNEEAPDDATDSTTG
jgi:hypothetical protein